MKKRVFVLIPAYNASATIAGLFARVPAAVKERIERYLVVDDGSSDGTAAAVEALLPSVPNLTLLRHSSNRGYGAAMKTLLQRALAEGAEVAVTLHADGQYSPELLAEILALFDRERADVVQGSRFLGGGALQGGMPFYKYLANRSLTALENLVFGLSMAEFHSGYMSYSRTMLERAPFGRLSDSFDFDLEMIVMAKILGLPLREVPIPTIYADEVSHLNPLRYGFDVLAVIARYFGGHYRRLTEEHNANTPTP